MSAAGRGPFKILAIGMAASHILCGVAVAIDNIKYLYVQNVSFPGGFGIFLCKLSYFCVPFAIGSSIFILMAIHRIHNGAQNHQVEPSPGGLKTSDRDWTVMNVLKALIQNCKMANALQILHLLFSLKMTSRSCLERRKLAKHKRRSPSSLNLVVLGAIMNTVCVDISPSCLAIKKPLTSRGVTKVLVASFGIVLLYSVIISFKIKTKSAHVSNEFRTYMYCIRFYSKEEVIADKLRKGRIHKFRTSFQFQSIFSCYYYVSFVLLHHPFSLVEEDSR